MFNYHQILGINKKEKEFKELWINFINKEDFLLKEDFEKVGLDHNNIKFIIKHNELVSFREYDIFKEKDDKIYFINDKFLRENINETLKKF